MAESAMKIGAIETYGGLRLAPFVADLVQGEWDVQLPDGTVYDPVTCRDLFIWSFRKAFVVLNQTISWRLNSIRKRGV